MDVHLNNGMTRQYSLTNCPSESHRYVLGVQHDANSRGGSHCLHQDYREGDLLRIGEPRNLFAIDPETQSALLFAGGIGITPILAMAYRLREQNIPFELHYFVRTHEMIAFYGNLTQHFAEQVQFHVSDEPNTQCDMQAVLAAPDDSRHLYVCCAAGVYGVCDE